MRRGLAVLAIALVAASAIAGGIGVVSAQSGTGDDAASGPFTEVVVADGETVNGSRVVGGGTVVVRGTLRGDLKAYAGTVVVTGNVTGNLQAFGAGVVVAGHVGGDAVAYANRVTVTEDATISEALNVGGRRVAVDGTVGTGVQALGGTVVLGPSARVGGDVEYDATLVDRGAVVGGRVLATNQYLGPLGVVFDYAGYAPFAAPWLALCLAGLFHRRDPAFAEHTVRHAAADPLRCGWRGLAAALATVLGVLALVASVLGIPLAAAALPVLLVGGLTASGFGLVAGGRAVSTLAGRTGWRTRLTGGVFAAVVATLPVVGGWVLLAALLVGVGGVVSASERWPASRFPAGEDKA